MSIVCDVGDDYMCVCDLYYIQLTISVGSGMPVCSSYVGMIDADY